MDRTSGFYWVKFYDKWTIAEYVCEDDTDGILGYWYILASDESFDDSFFQEIGEKIERY